MLDRRKSAIQRYEYVDVYYLYINACPYPSTDIDPQPKALWPISDSRDDNSSDMEKGMH